jgi:ABC-type dipeptide/oligopeptide/nickel transport system ATPase component
MAFFMLLDDERANAACTGVSFQTRGAEKVGIVGRTGSGKSSIFQALYRLAEIDRKGNKSPIRLILASCLAVLRIRDDYPGSRIKMIPDPGSTSQNLSIFTPKDP